MFFLNIFKFLFGVIILILFSLLLGISYFSNNTKYQNIDSIFQEKYYSGSIKNNINYIDSIFTKNKNNFEVKKENNKINIKLKKGFFAISLSDLSQNYTITSTGFIIDIKFPGDIIIDNTQKNITIFSINSLANLIFTKTQNNEKINNILLYPHELYKFNPLFTNISIKKESDIYRIKTINKLNNIPYFKDKLKQNSFDKLKLIFGEENLRIIKNFLSFKKDEIKNNEIIYQKLTNLQKFNFPFFNLIEKYEKYFINNTKKISFYENVIYNNIVDIIKSNDYNSKSILLINKNLEKLKKLDKNEYKKIKNIINNFYKVFLLENIIGNNNKLKSFLYIKQQEINSYLKLNYIKLKQIYFKYDFLEFKDFKYHFKNFLNIYLIDNGVIKDKNKLILKSKNNKKELESFIFFLKEYINAYLFIGDSNYLEIENEILEKYLGLNKIIYFSGKEESNKIRTSLKQNKILLERINEFLKNNFFKEKRDKNNLLLLKKKKINHKELKKLQKEVNTIFELYSNYKSFLKEADKQDIKIYNFLIKEFNEKFNALNNYDKYVIENNKKIKDIYNTIGIGIKQNKDYTIDNIKNYFSNFNGFYYDKIIKKDNYFIIKNVNIDGKTFNFKFFPQKFNKLDVYNKKEKLLYSFDSLDDIKELWDEKKDGADESKKEQYDFKNFFKITFSDTKTEKKEISMKEKCAFEGKKVDPNNPNKCLETSKDTPIIFHIKQRLINNEFNIINKFFKINYENISIKQGNNNDYLITLNNVKIKFMYNNRSYDIYFSSNYNFEKHYFYNIKLKLKESSEKNNFILEGAYIKYSKFKKIKLKELENFLKIFFEKLDNIKLTFYNIRYNYTLNNLEIKTLLGKKFDFIFSINNKNIVIKLENNKIYSIIVNGNKINNQIIKINELKKYFNKF